MARHSILSAVLLATLAHGPALAEAAPFAAEISAIARRDQAHPVPQGGVLFLGSSSIRLWNVAASFPEAQTINHGFGGATVTDVLRNYGLLVADHQPDHILVYVGENDLAQERDPAAVAHDVITLLTRLRADFPTARIAYLSIKYAPVRWSHRQAIGRANALIRDAARRADRIDYIDASRDLLVGDDSPDVACYGSDGLHLNQSGYSRWNRIVRSYLTHMDGPGNAGGKAAGGTSVAHRP